MTRRFTREPRGAGLARAPRIGAVAGAVLAFSGVAASAARPAQRFGRVAAQPALAVPVQPLRTASPPPREHRLPFGSLRLSQSTIVAAAEDQDITVTVNPDQATSPDRLRVRIYRPALQSSPQNGRGIGRVELSSRTLNLEGTRAESVTFSNLDPPPGSYRLEVINARSGQVVGTAPLIVYAQDRLPAGASGSAGSGPWAGDAAAGRTLASPSTNNNLSNDAVEESESYVGVEADNPARVIAGINPVGGGNPKAWVSNSSMTSGSAVVNTLPSTTKRATAEGGGTFTASLCCDPTFAADDRGNFWYGVLSINPNSHIIVNRMAGPAGTTFQTQNTAVPRFTSGTQDKPMITIDNGASSMKRYMLYATWVENPGQNVVVSQCDASTASTCDNPDSWSVPAKVTGAGATYTYPSIAAAPNGDLYITWWDATNDKVSIDRCLAAEDCSSAASWNEDADIDTDLDPGSASALPFFCPIISAPAGRVGALTYVDVGADGKVYVAWSELRNNNTTRCTASGTDRTFDSYVAHGASANTIPVVNTGVRLSDDSASALNDHFFASLAADPSAAAGTVETALNSTKLDSSGQTTQQFYVSSSNGGVSFGPMQQISTAASDYSAGLTGNDYGDYEGADAAGGVFYPSWTDNRAAAGGDGELFMLTAPGSGGSGGGGGGGDTTPPNTTIEKGPKKKTHSHKAKFKFSSNEPGSSFQCKLDRKPFKSCTSPKKYANLKPGRHKFQVRGIDAAGNTDSTPATRKWKVLAS